MKRLGIIALLLTLCVIAAGCSAQSDNKNEKGTGGNTSVSVSQSSTTKAGETTTAKSGKEGATLETVTDSGFEGEVVTFGPVDNQENNNKKDNKDKKDEKESSTDSDDNKSYETPIIPIH